MAVPPKSLLTKRMTVLSEPLMVPASVHAVLRSPGRPLEPAARNFFETLFRHEFSKIRVHADPKAAESAQSVHASAYTVGHDVVFGKGRYAFGTPLGRRLMAHELSHVIQQSGASSSLPLKGALKINQSGDDFEHEADVAAECVMAGVPARGLSRTRELSIQRQTPDGDVEKKPPEKKEAGEVIIEGLKTAAEQAVDNNPKIMKVIIDPIKDKFKSEWDRLGAGEKAASIGLGVATLGLAGGAMLADTGGRKKLESVNLATPLSIVPYMPLNSFKYTLPSGDSPEKRMFKFETGFKVDDLINLRTEGRGLSKMSLSVNMQWGYDPATERMTVLGGDASLGIVPGLSILAGAYKDVLRSPQTVIGPEGRMTEIKKSVPEFDKPQSVPDVRIMVNVDLMKFKPGDLVRQLKSVF